MTKKKSWEQIMDPERMRQCAAAYEEASQRRHEEKLARGAKYPLEKSAEEALEGSNPQRVWEELCHLVRRAIEEEYTESEKVFQEALQVYPDSMADYFPYVDDLLEFLTGLNPKRGINDFHYINPDFPLNLEGVLLAAPLEALKAVLRMVTVSDRWLEAL